jgi:malic enzyme
VAVIFDGTASWGWQPRRPGIETRVEGKGVLFNRFADIEFSDMEVDTKDPDEFTKWWQPSPPHLAAS